MARSGSFPKALAKLHPEHKTPTNAILAQMALNIGAGLFVGAVWGSDDRVLLRDRHRAGAGRDGRLHHGEPRPSSSSTGSEKPDEFNWMLHFVFPVVSSVVLIYACYRGFFDPFPAAPYNLAPFIVGGWLLIGVLILLVLRVARQRGVADQGRPGARRRRARPGVRHRRDRRTAGA